MRHVVRLKLVTGTTGRMKTGAIWSCDLYDLYDCDNTFVIHLTVETICCGRGDTGQVCGQGGTSKTEKDINEQH